MVDLIFGWRIDHRSAIDTYDKRSFVLLAANACALLAVIMALITLAIPARASMNIEVDRLGARRDFPQIPQTTLTSAISYPANGGYFNGLTSITGSASSNTNRVAVSFKRNQDGKYWDGSNWLTTTQLFLTATDATSWSFDANSVAFSNTLSYTLQSRAKINPNTYEIPGNGITVSIDNGTPLLTATVNVSSSPFLSVTGMTLYYSHLMGSPQPFDVAGTATDAEGNLDRASASPAFGSTPPDVPNPTAWSFAYSVTSAYSGSGTITITVSDKAANYITQTVQYIDDGTPPTSTVTSMSNGSSISSVGAFGGLSRDNTGGAGVRKVELSLRRNKDTQYWLGGAWGITQTWLIAMLDGGDAWSLDPGPVNYSATLSYTLQSRATDYVGNPESTGHGITFTKIDNRVYLPAVLNNFPVPPSVYCGTAQTAAWQGGLPFGSAIDAILIGPKRDGKIVYAGATTSPGIYVSRDGGTSWPDVASVPPALSFAADPFVTTTIYAGTFGAGIYTSTNEGATWGALASQPNANVWSFAISTISPSTFRLLAGTSNGVYYSQSPYTVWTQSTGAITGKVVYAMALGAQPGVLFASTSGNGVYKSTDGGASWTQSSIGLGNVTVPSLAVGPSGILYAGVNGLGVYISSNSGGSWTQANSGIGNVSVKSLAVDALNTQIIYAGTQGSGLFVSSNQASSWVPYIPTLSQTTVFAMALDSRCYHRLFAGTLNGAWYIDTSNNASP